MVDEYLHSLEFSLPTNAVYILDSTQIQEEERLWQARSGQGRADQGDSDEYYDGFRCLYNEEMIPGADGSDGEFETHQKNISPCPPLHPAVS